MVGKSPALIIVDVQNDFCPGGTLPVQHGDRVIPMLNRYARLFAQRQLPVFASRDYHPARTVHFQKYGGVWPIHCVQGTPGAEFHPMLELPEGTILITKGTSPDRDDYSAFDGTTAEGVSLAEKLRSLSVDSLYIGGLTTDYCVKESVLAGLKEGLAMTVLQDAIQGVDLVPGDSRRALEVVAAAGARTATFEEVAREISAAAVMSR